MNKKIVVVAGLALALTACGKEGGTTAAPATAAKPGEKPGVCLVMKSLANEFFQQMQKGAEEHAAKRGDLTLSVVGIQNETDIDNQVAAVEKCVTQQAKAVVIAPADSRALVAPIKRAVDAGVKVVNIDVQLDEGAMKAAGIGDKVPFVGPDNREGAKQSGMELVKALGKDAEVVILEGNPGAANAAQRKAGFEDAIKAGGLKLVDSKTAHWETDEAHTVFGNMLTGHPNIKGVLAGNDNMALGALKAIEEQGKKGQIKVAAFDNIPAIAQYVKDGSVVSTLDQYGAQQASNGIDYAMKMIAGENFSGWQKTEIKLITKDNVG
ncbi:sugar ABC transporter substrate-binding protein [Nonomuraea guangzhouensis]|uniref:Sugar ABC transporter substrate-binding protein n=1 Tax=Nonomuraea guangzhouensis TaxID=1291555 RepID=A0ABW4GFW8_9ACTN|nr:sugar ABC transporter substrate-binding protein [Nonomuraea guangzhouensis]